MAKITQMETKTSTDVVILKREGGLLIYAWNLQTTVFIDVQLVSDISKNHNLCSKHPLIQILRSN